MPLDSYSICPCGTGKKVKFCCPDLLGELQKIDRMLEGEQHLGCLKHIDQLLQQHPDRACLLSLKSMLLRNTGEVEEAGRIAEEFVRKHPDNPTALAESAMLTAVDGGGRSAVEKLQRAMAVSQGQIQGRLYEAMGAVAEILLHQGLWLAGRALLQLQTAIVKEDERAVSLLIELNRSPSVPLLLKDDPPIEHCPDDAPWKERFDRAMLPIQAGNWAVAAENLTQLTAEVDDSPAIWRNLATLRGWLADQSGHVEALQKLASLGVDEEEAVEAEALAMLCSDDPLGDRLEVFNLLWTIKDFEPFQAALSLDRRAMQIPFDPSMFGSEGNPPPKAAYLLLDRPLADTAAGVTLDDVSKVLGQAMVYGRQTDRDARLEVIGVASDDLKRLKTLLGEMAGDAPSLEKDLDPDFEQEVMARVSASQELLQRKWQMPEDVTREQLEALVAEHTRDALLNRWPQLNLGIFDGKSARQIADQPAWRTKLSAAVMVLEMWHEQVPGAPDFDELRQQLRLPLPQPIDPKQTPVETVPLVRLSRVMVEQTDDEALRTGFRRAMAFGATEALKKFARAVVDRETLAGGDEQAMAYALLAQTEKDPERALKHIERGRQAGQSAGRSCASWDLMELTYRFARGEHDELSRLINHIQSQHLREPGVAERLTQWLMQVGAIRPDGTPAGPPSQQAAPAAAVEGGEGAGSGKLWTPDSQQPGGQKKLWTPD